MNVTAIVMARGGRMQLELSGAATRDQLPEGAAVTEVALAPGASASAALHASLAIALEASELGWVWLLEDVVPQDGAFAALSQWLDMHPDLNPVLLASRVEEPDGRLRFFRDWPHYGDIDAVVAGAQVRAMPLRAASFHGLLVRADVIRAAGLPLTGDEAWRAENEFTARLLRHGEGWLVPSSVVRLSDAAREPAVSDDLRNQLWTARGPAWTARERLDRHIQWAVRAIREPDRGAALAALRAGLRPRPR